MNSVCAREHYCLWMFVKWHHSNGRIMSMLIEYAPSSVHCQVDVQLAGTGWWWCSRVNNLVLSSGHWGVYSECINYVSNLIHISGQTNYSTSLLHSTSQGTRTTVSPWLCKHSKLIFCSDDDETILKSTCHWHGMRSLPTNPPTSSNRQSEHSMMDGGGDTRTVVVTSTSRTHGK